MADILHNVYIHASPDKVFKAISIGSEIEKWWTKRSTGKAIKGEVFNLFFTPEYDWNAELINVEKNAKCEWKVTKADADWIDTLFGFQLSKLGDITLAEFYHTGWPETNEHFRRSSYCWAMYLHLLKQYIESGKVIDFEDRTFV